MPVLVKTIATWIDVGHRERETILSSIVSGLAVLDLLRLMSNATLTTRSEGALLSTDAPLASSAEYPDLADAWIITAQDIAGDLDELYIPSPLLAETDVDGRNYNRGSAPWTGFRSFLAAMNHPYTSGPITDVIAAQIARAAPDITRQWYNFSTAIDWGRRTMFWRDVHGGARVTHIIGDVSNVGANFADVQAAMLALSSAVVTHYVEGAMNLFDDPPTTDMYNSVLDYCTFTFADVHGTQTTVTLPAPNRAIFLPDGKTVDRSQANVASFIAQAFTDLLVPSSLLPPVEYIGGTLHKTGVY